MSKTQRKKPLRLVLVVPFVLQIFATVGITGWLSLRNGQKAVNEVTIQLRSEITARIQQHLDDYLETPHLVNTISSDAIRRFHLWNPNDMSAMRSYFLWQLGQFKSVNYISFAGEKKEYAGAGYKPEDRTPVIEITDKSTQFVNTIVSLDKAGNPKAKETHPEYDPRVRPWYKAAKKAGKPVWNNIYQYYIQPSLGISVSQPVYDKKGKFIGVISTDLFLSGVSDFLQSLKIGKSGQTFIVERTGLIVASSTAEKPFVKSGDRDKVKRLQAIESSLPLIQSTAKYLIERFGNFSKIDSNQQLNYMMEGKRQFVQVVPFQDGRGLDWLIVAIVPEADFMEQIEANTRTTILLCAGALVLATILGILTARWITRPILHLIEASSAIARGELEQKVDVKGVDEIELLGDSFNQMAEQLLASFAALEKTNAELELRVEKRTAELKEAKIAADTASQAKSEFLTAMSHELRTPLNGILGYAQILERHPDSTPKQKNAIQIIQQCGSHLLTLINDILDLSKIEAGRMDLELKDFYFPSFLREVVELCRIQADRKEITFNYQFLNEIPTTIFADEKRVRQILINLLSNAIKFTDRGSVTFKVEVMSCRGNVELEKFFNSQFIFNRLPPLLNLRFQIEDTGIGMNEEELEKIFLPFEQVGKSELKAEGTGLGLAITQKIVQMMKGELKVESIPGKGSIFRVDLPALQAERDVNSGVHYSEIIISGFTGNKKKILIADDRPENRSFLSFYLNSIGFQVREAENGKDGLEKAAIFKPDLILIDIYMPVIDGWEMAGQLRKLPEYKDVILIASSASVYESDRQKSREVGFDDFLPKPIQIEALLKILQTHLQLQWIYPDKNLENSQTSSLIAPPPNELVALFKAARIGDIEVVEQEAIRFKDLDCKYQLFSDKLLVLARSFEEKEILRFVKQHLSGKAL